MLERFQQYIHSKDLFAKDEHVLLAVSGGIDSMVMVDLFKKSGYNFAIAHCNFKLRGEESDQDEILVRQIAENHGVEIFVKHFETGLFAEKEKVSIQMAARELRYKWFRELLGEENFDYIALAQHKDDAIETFFINLTRGTSISGLHGILPKKNNVIRPLLFTSKKEISDFAKANNVKFREDQSNSSEKYVRNKIRHSILPIFKEINPSFLETMTENIEKIQFVEKVYFQYIQEQKQKLLIHDGEKYSILIHDLIRNINSSSFLFELLKDFNFNQSVVNDIFNSLDSQSGKSFYSSTHLLIKDREKLLISKIEFENETDLKIEKIYIERDCSKIEIGRNCFKFEMVENNSDFIIDKISSKAFLDFDKLVFPLIIRKWQKGDSFFPFGMTQMKKLSDFFIDNKVSLKEKDEILILCSGENIVWVSSFRIDNRYRITNSTKKIYCIDLVK
ncbi:MAG: tRNA lysidine(34) synthetase TilS [Bacteroidetes bacterium]|nr:tRNA lysidine(34) synthetase TilS [Bacteroidota bacterium]